MMDKLNSLEDVRAYLTERRAELIVERKMYRETGDTMQAFEATGIALELTEILGMLPEEAA